MKITIKSATEIHDQTKVNATLIKSENQKTLWLQWIGANEARREINKMISKNYSQDPALYILKESTRSSSVLTFASPSSNVNWKKTKKKDKQEMKMATKMELWDSSNPPTGST